jgi:hypothetical protein
MRATRGVVLVMMFPVLSRATRTTKPPWSGDRDVKAGCPAVVILGRSASQAWMLLGYRQNGII